MKTYKRFGKVRLSRTQVKNNIVRIWMKASPEDKKNWYKEAFTISKRMSEDYDIDVMKVCGVIAALSPLKTWKKNIELAEDFLQTGRCGHMTTLLGKAERIVYLGDNPTTEEVESILNGDKIRAFFINIYNHDNRIKDHADRITVDRHAVKIATMINTDIVTKAQYRWLVQCYEYASKYIQRLEGDPSITPQQVQSGTWCAYRKIPLSQRKNMLV